MVGQDINEQLSSLDDGRHFEDESEDEDTPEFRASCEKLEEEMNRPEVMSEFQLDGAIYEQVDERMKENISNVLEACAVVRIKKYLAELSGVQNKWP
ncbi:MAG: hypothetical protein KTM48_05285, partial [Wolbachia endosymbiont of Pissodes strobi]|nr:hypothetical protein [Wolbachia endosymbiont of Pissodes strobi]